MAKKNHYVALGIVALLIVGAIYYLESERAGPSDIEGTVDIVPTQQNPTETEEPTNEPEQETVEEEQSKIPDSYIPNQKAIAEKETKFKRAPDLQGIVGYINSGSDISLEQFRGKVVLIDFWTYSCINCIRTLPYLKEWHSVYEDQGLVIIGVHTPEFQFEKKIENVQNAVDTHEIKYRVVQDNNYKTWRAYENRFWPRKYVIDIDGFIRYDRIGEGAYDATETAIRELLKEKMERDGQGELSDDRADVEETAEASDKEKTPEIYFGEKFSRGNFPQGLQLGEYRFSYPAIAKNNNAYFDGDWKVTEDYSEVISESGRVLLAYNAKSVNIVASSDPEADVKLFVDTRPLSQSMLGNDARMDGADSVALIDKEGLYNIVDMQEHVPGLLEITAPKGFRIYTFTFG